MRCPTSAILLVHLANDLDEGFFGCFRLPIPLRVIGRWPVMLHLIELQLLPHFSVDKWSTIVTYNFVRPPNWTIIFSLMKFATAPLVALRSVIASAHLVKYSVATRIHMYSWEGGLTSSIKSSPQVRKGHGVTMLCKLCGWVRIKLACT